MGGKMKVKMDGHVVFNSTAKAAAWLHATGQTKAKDSRSVQMTLPSPVRLTGLVGVW